MVLWFSEINGQRAWLSELYHIKINDPEQLIKSVNWWKVLGCDCVGDIVGGAYGYLGVSACSVIMQL